QPAGADRDQRQRPPGGQHAAGIDADSEVVEQEQDAQHDQDEGGNQATAHGGFLLGGWSASCAAAGPASGDRRQPPLPPPVTGGRAAYLRRSSMATPTTTRPAGHQVASSAPSPVSIQPRLRARKNRPTTIRTRAANTLEPMGA